ncbi:MULTISPECIES: DEAD/DEAH box helicase [unclassified Fusibacter]|uniref:DEAD/DEAH box helicase n=1 Tax=unclassified Fusibacter TaxID=2624464 RepID=UPI0010137B7B|nr:MULTISPECIES: DEAD/DEAH box helicase [unclassified Fusibacter]MCK8058591.1 DEAD/DEAH box helicase [Fusibacter sp. A2]NPE22639.1 DEAD/DEAH box helicase [Fusibacter sp. A1]RXV60203.1 ATP-dependent helicase [Fusibacter sp. A1]
MKTAKFKDYTLSEDILKAIDLMGFDHPTGVQAKVIPDFLLKKDIIVKSQTGSGKTAAFGIPLCEMIEWDENKPQAMVITPTRELAVQVKEDLFHIGRFKRLKVVPVYGKSPFHLQEKQLKQKSHIVVGTPGRLIDHLKQGTLDVSEVRFLVVDEADEMLRMGFIEQLDQIISSLPKGRSSILLSATMPDDIERICRKYMKSAVHVEIEDASPAISRIEQTQISVRQNDKSHVLEQVLITQNPESCMIFCNTQLAVEEICESLNDDGINADKIHGGMEQRDRLKVMDKFRNGKFRYLVATDVAARGIDIDNIGLVINFDVPNTQESYVHRIGRTGRIGMAGKAITFVTTYEKTAMEEIVDYIGREIPQVDKPLEELIEEAKKHFYLKAGSLPEEKKTKGSEVNKGILKLHIKGGKKTKMRAVDLVGGLCALDGIEASDIGIINILDVSTYVEILNDKGMLVLEALKTNPIKGRIRTVSIADK